MASVKAAVSDSPSGAVQASTEVPTPPVPVGGQDVGPNWAAIAALLISLFTLAKTLFSDWRARRAKAAAKFEADFGTPVRTILRAFEKSLATLRIYTLPSGKAIDDLKVEIEKERSKWLDSAYEVGRLLNEVDDMADLMTPAWSPSFIKRADEAEGYMLAMTESSTVDVAELARLAGLARDELNLAIVEVRASLRDEAASYDRLGFRRTR